MDVAFPGDSGRGRRNNLDSNRTLQVSLRAILVLTLMVAVLLAIAQAFTWIAACGCLVLYGAVGLHVLATRVGRGAINAGSTHSKKRDPLESIMAQHNSMADYTARGATSDADSVTAAPTPRKLTCCFIGMLLGPATCFLSLSWAGATNPHPLTIAAVCLSGTLLGMAACMLLAVLVNMLRMAIRFLGR
jgi:hypothetical protein